MSALADANAILDVDRILPQHQVALSLLQARVANPQQVAAIRWLDLACGRGQMIVAAKDGLSEQARKRIEYWPYDIDHNYLRETRKRAENLGFSAVHGDVLDLKNFSAVCDGGAKFDFITMTNTVHEVAPSHLAGLLFECLFRLASDGTLFLYDVEKVSPPELGAIPWCADEIRKITREMLASMGSVNYLPEVGQWHHKTCNAWNVQFQQQYICLDASDMLLKREASIASTVQVIYDLVQRKREECQRALEMLTRYGVGTLEEVEQRERLLHEFWALSRALEVVR